MAKQNTLYANHPFYKHNILLAIVSEISFLILQQNLVKKMKSYVSHTRIFYATCEAIAQNSMIQESA